MSSEPMKKDIPTLKHDLEKTGEHLKQRAEKCCDEVKGHVNDRVDMMVDCVKSKPLAFVGGALALGYLLGKVCSLRRA